MCVTAIIAIASVAIGAVGTVASISAANANKRAAQFEADMKVKQLFREREGERIRALQTENVRADAFNQARSSAMAAIGASGLGEHISFFQAIDPEAKKAFLRDVSTVRLNMTAKRASITDEIGVTEFKKDIAVFNSKISKVGAIADFMQTAMGAASFYNANATPKPATAGGG
jgi:hypothetical protein